MTSRIFTTKGRNFHENKLVTVDRKEPISEMRSRNNYGDGSAMLQRPKYQWALVGKSLDHRRQSIWAESAWPAPSCAVLTRPSHLEPSQPGKANFPFMRFRYLIPFVSIFRLGQRVAKSRTYFFLFFPPWKASMRSRRSWWNPWWETSMKGSE